MSVWLNISPREGSFSWRELSTHPSWKDRQGESHTQISINADSIAFVNAGKKDEQNADPKKAAKKGAKAKNTPQPPQDAPAPDEKDMPF